MNTSVQQAPQQVLEGKSAIVVKQQKHNNQDVIYLFYSAGKYETKSLFEQSVKSCKGFSIAGKTVAKDL